ncbi:P-loop ATPase, Sll1717 family [Streptomyces sp. NPDC021080]|uniref:P-loop ATPase, Sll1717 family n=1 Tax=Streptomyces sp. NPDC021080 TaxID=3365110 RepID=UPI0037B2E8B0
MATDNVEVGTTQGDDLADQPVLARLHFGREDAERDVTEGLLLRGGFLPNAAYRAALSGRKMLIIGRKGSGKSAICMRLMSDVGHGSGKVLVTPDEAAGEEIRRFELQGLPGDSAKALIWRYVFAVHAARHLVGHAKGAHDKKPDSVKVLGRFLKQNGEGQDGGGRLVERLAQGARGLQGSLSLEAFGVKASVGLAQSPSEGARAARQLEIVEQGVARAFADLGCDGVAHPPLLLMVDQLEQVWSAEPDSNSMVIGLLLAAKHVASLYGRSVRFLLFLRADIYDSLSFGEGDKFHGDELRIAWTEQALRDLALARAQASVGAWLTEEQLWKELFPQTVGGEEITTYLFRRCLPRPRDAIQFLNACVEKAWLEQERDLITELDVVQAGRQFSEWKLKDLTSEYLVAHPFLRNLFPLFQNTGYVVTRAALARRFEAASATLHHDFPAYVNVLTLSGVIDVLHSVGLLGVRRGNDVVFSGDDGLPVQPHETEFQVHPCFRAALGATSAVDLRRFEPQLMDARIASGNFSPGTSGISSLNRDDRLLMQLARSCHSILAQVGRAVALTQDVRDEITVQVNRVLDDVNRIPPGAASSVGVDVDDYLLRTARYLTTLAAQLRAGGLEETTGIDDVVRRLDEEERRLRRSAGGSYGSSGDSSGY